MADEAKRASEILRALRESFALPKWALSNEAMDPFKALVLTVISQNTSDRNAERAFESLSKKFAITPDSLSKADAADVEEALKVAGLQRVKAKTLKLTSLAILERFNGSLDFIYSLPLEEARKALMRLPGVGPKTADVVLLFCAKKQTFPVDTHVNRVSKRLGLAPRDVSYEGVRKSLQESFEPRDYLSAHLLLISLGRAYCKARRPSCSSCLVKSLCPSAGDDIKGR